MSAITISPAKLPAILDYHIATKTSAMIWGPPGVGKSAMVRQAAARNFEAKANGKRFFIDLRGPTIDAVDLRGLPTIEDKIMKFAQSGLLPIAGRDADFGVVFLDELPGADAMVQKGFLELADPGSRSVGDYTLPEGWITLAAGNRREDRAGVGQFNSALANRFSHYTLEVDHNAWSKHAIASGWPAEVVAFIRFRPELLHSFDADRLVNATPRSWEMMLPVLKAGLDPETEMTVIAGTVGEGPAAEFVAFLKIWRSLPNPDAILMDPDSAAVPDAADVTFATIGALARKVTPQTMANLVKYLKRLPAEYGVACIADAKARDSSIVGTTAFIEWSAANSDVYL